jgi:signal transduction histidine kinase
MLLLMGLAGIDALRSLHRLHQVSHEVTERYSAHNQALQAILVCFRVYDAQMEQYLLADVIVTQLPDQGRDKVASRGSELHAAVHAYPHDSSGQEDSLVRQIAQAVDAEDAAFDGTKDWRAGERDQRVHIFIAQELIPMRTQVMALAAAVARANNERLAAENAAVATEFLGLQTRLSRLVVTTLVAGLLLSLAAGYYILRLEQNGRKRYLALERSRYELENLSKRLVEAQEAERRSISRELHDEVGQTLGAILVDLGQLANFVPPADTLIREQIGRIKVAAESAVRSIRDMALLLRPPMLDDLGLVPALEWQARETSRRGEMEVEVHAGDIPATLPDQVKIGVYRLVQEALQNAATHAHAKNANVRVEYDPQKVQVEISDDGVGFQPERTRGMGILGMEERVRQLGGTFDLQSSPGKGTMVHAVFPTSDSGGA